MVKGNRALERVVEDHGEHDLAVYAQMVRGLNAARDLKIVDAAADVEARGAQLDDAEDLLTEKSDASNEDGKGLDSESQLVMIT